MGRLDGKVAVITGGTSGIGEATVRLFAEEGARVVLCGRSSEAGEAIAAELGENARFVQADVTREDDIVRTIRVATDTFGRLDILFNNAGGSTPGGMETMTVDQFHYGMDLLLGSVLLGIKHAAPIMREQKWGRIINNSSINGIRAVNGDWLYGAAKAAVTHVTKVAAIRQQSNRGFADATCAASDDSDFPIQSTHVSAHLFVSVVCSFRSSGRVVRGDLTTRCRGTCADRAAVARNWAPASGRAQSSASFPPDRSHRLCRTPTRC